MSHCYGIKSLNLCCQPVPNAAVFRFRYAAEPKAYRSAESVATLPPFGPIEGHKWFDQISSQWESKKNWFALISFGKIQFLPPCIWNLPFMSYRLSRKTLRKRTSSCPVQHIEQSKCIKLNIDTNIHLTLYKALHFWEGPKKIVKIF